MIRLISVLGLVHYYGELSCCSSVYFDSCSVVPWVDLVVLMAGSCHGRNSSGAFHQDCGRGGRTHLSLALAM